MRPSPLSTAPSRLHRLAAPGSVWLTSASLVLLGSYLRLHDAAGRNATVAMRDVFGTHLAYELALLLVIAFLWRVRGEVRDTWVLLAVLGAFVLDLPLLQQIYGWGPGDGMLAALIGIASAVAVVLTLAASLGLAPFNRLFGVVLATAAFERFGPALLVPAPATHAISPRLVALGWLFAATLVPILLPSATRARSRLPLAAIEVGGIGGALAVGLLHFVTAGEGFALRFHQLYLAPFVILLGPAIERLAPAARSLGAGRIALDALPYVGLALAASCIPFPSSLVDSEWARAWPLTPFYLALALAAAVEAGRAWRDRHAPRAHAAAALALMAALGGDLPEILAAARFPAWWQVAVTLLVAWTTILLARDPALGLALHGIAAFVLASAIAERGYAWSVAYVLVLCWGGLAIEALSGWRQAPRTRFACVLSVTLLPVAAMLMRPGHWLPAGLAAFSIAAAALVGRQRGDCLLAEMARVTAVIGLIGYPFALQQRGGVALGTMLTELGFVVLLLGLLHSLYGHRLMSGWRDWWSEAASGRHAPEPEIETEVSR